MKTIRISDETNRKLTATLGMLMAETMKGEFANNFAHDFYTSSRRMRFNLKVW